MTPDRNELLRSLPSVSAVLEHEEVRNWQRGVPLPRPSSSCARLRTGLPQSVVAASIQAVLAGLRAAILAGERSEPVELAEVLAQAEAEVLRRSSPSLGPVINATGIVLHTGLGRAPLCEAAVEAIVEGAAGYCNLEYDLSSGHRGRRNVHVAEHLASLTGAESATVVNNNAAATLLILQTFAAGNEVIVSRGQLIEIGGSFRLPDIMRAGGATLREVGTTNRTRIADYEGAINDHTALLLHVHTSNYRVVGFTETVPIGGLAELAHRYGLIAVDDLGSGALFDLSACGLPGEPCVRDSLAGGADLVCFSGDKLLGGPQCGLIVGKQSLVEQLEANPLMRTYRVGKLTLLALEATLRCYREGDEALSQIPALSMLSASADVLAARAKKLAEQLEAAMPDENFYVCSDVGFAGGGSMPAEELQTVVVRWRVGGVSAQSMASALREADVPVIVRIRDDEICFDLRSLQETEFDTLVDSASGALGDSERIANGE